jgi:protein-L-isoaspartate(D-aspartate) O-methyltransferase
LPPDRSVRRTRIALWLAGVCVALAALIVTSSSESDADRRSERAAMVEGQIAERGITEPRLLAALRAVPRHRFVPDSWQAQAYADGPLPIGEGQTISQPYVVAKMTELAALRPTDRVFELGTGSGYQAAVASRLCAHVFSVEIQPLLAERAARLLRELGYENVSVRSGDGFRGWPEEAPFDAMLITAAVPEIPDRLLKQLKPGGRAVLPIGPALGVQDLVLVEKGADGRTITRKIFPVRFVPATGTP